MAYNLADMKKDVEKKFAPIEFELPDDDNVQLRNPIRFSKDERKEMRVHLDKMFDEDDKTDDEDEFLEHAKALLVLAADKNGQKFVDLLEDDFALIMAVLDNWIEGTQAGEADSSQD